jgi:hypothetical protein
MLMPTVVGDGLAGLWRWRRVLWRGQRLARCKHARQLGELHARDGVGQEGVQEGEGVAGFLFLSQTRVSAVRNATCTLPLIVCMNQYSTSIPAATSTPSSLLSTPGSSTLAEHARQHNLLPLCL